MAINKNFVVKNGLEVNTQLIYADGDTNKVGIASTAPNVELDVRGGIAASNTTVAGVSTVLTALRVGNQEGRVLTILAGSGQTAVGIGTTIPEFLLDVRSYDGTGTGKTAMHVYGDVRITGDLSMDDLTLDNANLTSLVVTGMSTFKDDVAYEGSRVGVTSFLWDSTEDSLEFLDHTKLTFGDSKDLQIYHDATDNIIKGAQAGQDLYISAEQGEVYVQTDYASKNAISCHDSAGVKIYYNNSQKFETTSTGINVTGISTFSKFVDINESADIAGGVSVTGLSTFTGNVDINSDVDINRSLGVTGGLVVGGATSLAGGVIVTGLSTFTGNVDINADADILRSLAVTGGATVTGLSTFTGNVDVNSDVDINRSLGITGGLVVGGATTLSGELSFANNVDINADVDILRSLSVTGGATVTGLSTFTGNVDVNSDVDINRSLGVTGGLVVGGATSLAGISTFDTQGIRLAGVMTATKYYGDGNGLYGVVAETSYAVVAGVATVAMGVTAGISLEGVSVTGVSTFQYMNITGICSAKGGINIGAGTGATIFNPSGSGNEMTFGTNNVERLRIDSSGTASFTGDVSIADKIIHTGDTNTAIRFPSADTFTVETGGSERLRIASDGKVGIGTDSPIRPLSVSNGGAEGFEFGPGDGAGYNLTLHYNRSTSSYIGAVNQASYHTWSAGGSSEKMRLDSSGYVGITSTVPTVRLDISSGDATVMKMDAGAANGGGMAIHHQNTVKGYFGIAGSNYLGGSSANDIVLRAENRLDVAVSNTKKLDVNGGGVNITGVCTATSFVGDGSGLSGVESWNQQDTWLYAGG